jgi:hypothetical protein
MISVEWWVGEMKERRSKVCEEMGALSQERHVPSPAARAKTLLSYFDRASLSRDLHTPSFPPCSLMVTHHTISLPPPVLGRSNVSHRLALSQQEKVKLWLTLSTFSAACFTGILLFIAAVPLPVGFPTLRDDYHSRSPTSRSGHVSPTTADSWASYSPYYPAGKYEQPTREGCVVSQVNIVSSFPSPWSIPPSNVPSRSFNGTGLDTQLPARLCRF